jgi:hypothetical protein
MLNGHQIKIFQSGISLILHMFFLGTVSTWPETPVQFQCFMPSKMLGRVRGGFPPSWGHATSIFRYKTIRDTLLN